MRVCGNIIVKVGKDNYVYEDGEKADIKDLKGCPHCGKKREEGSSEDPCLGKLPGVLAACCGHGGVGHNRDGTGYILFENGLYIRGYFTEIKKYNRNKSED